MNNKGNGAEEGINLRNTNKIKNTSGVILGCLILGKVRGREGRNEF